MTFPPSGAVPYDGGEATPPLPRNVESPRATGKELLSAAWSLLKRDRELLWLPVISALFGLLAAAILFVPGYVIGHTVGGEGHRSWAMWVGLFFAGLGSSFVAIYFQSALVIGANLRADGGTPTLRGVLRAAWADRAKILSWALMTTTVGTAIRAVERRVGVAGRILGFLGGLAWAIASFLVVPVIVAENLGPVDAVKRSSALIRETWGTGLRSTLRFGLIQFVVLIPVAIVGGIGVAMLMSGSAAPIAFGLVLTVAAVIAFFGMMMVFDAVGTYARAMLYRYATGRPVPGIDPLLFAGALRARRNGRRRWA
jgi:hypothetical protein